MLFFLSFSDFSKTNTKVIAACRLSARLLERVILGHTVAETLQWAVTLAKLSKLSSSKSSKSSAPIVTSPIAKKGQNLKNDNLIDSKFQSFDNVLGLDENEIEFLDSILPVEPEIIPCKSYGSCAVEINVDYCKRDISPHKYKGNSHTGERIVDSNRSTISTSKNQNDAANGHYPSPDNADNHYHSGQNSKNIEKCRIKSVTGVISEKIPSPHTSHHRRSINRGTSNKSIPFSLAVEEIGITAQVSEQYATL